MKKKVISILLGMAMVGVTVNSTIATNKAIKESQDLNEQIARTLIDIESNKKLLDEINSSMETKILQMEERILNIENEVKHIKDEIKKRKVEFVLTFYTTLNVENGWGPINCLGEPLKAGMVANNVLPLGTKIDLGGEYGVVEVRDRGGKNFDVLHRLDVLIMRNPGESDSDYFKRVNDYGIKRVTGYIIE